MRQSIIAISLVLSVLIAIGLGIYSYSTTIECKLATGQSGGTYNRLGSTFASTFNLQTKQVSLEAIESAGSIGNAKLVAERKVDFAFVQNDGDGFTTVRAVAPLYKEVLHIITRNKAVQSIDDLRNLRVACGAKDSGTSALAKLVLKYFEMSIDDVQAKYLSSEDAIKGLKADKLDVVMMVGGVRDQRIVRCLDVPDTRLIGLDSKVIEAGNAAGFCTANPFYTPYNIPKHLYGQAPHSPISTIAVEALLVSHRDTPKDVVHEVARLLFANRSNLVEQNPALADLSEGFNRGRLRYPLHSGAQAYLERENPGFLVKYAEAMGFVVSIIVTLFAFLAGVHEQLKRTKKNRIDDYYEQVGELLKEIGNEIVDLKRLKAIRRELWEIEQRAFRELIDEKLMADESFSIFQAVLSQCLGQAERLIDRGDRAQSHDQEPKPNPETPKS